MVLFNTCIIISISLHNCVYHYIYSTVSRLYIHSDKGSNLIIRYLFDYALSDELKTDIWVKIHFLREVCKIQSNTSFQNKEKGIQYKFCIMVFNPFKNQAYSWISKLISLLILPLSYSLALLDYLPRAPNTQCLPLLLTIYLKLFFVLFCLYFFFID